MPKFKVGDKVRPIEVAPLPDGVTAEGEGFSTDVLYCVSAAYPAGTVFKGFGSQDYFFYTESIRLTGMATPVVDQTEIAYGAEFFQKVGS